jgi:arginine:agmatine antiporter
MGIVPHKELINSTAPFADAARYMFGSVVGNITSALSIIACFGSLPGWLILTTEAPRSGVKTGLFPKFFAELNKNDFPAKGLIFTAILMTLVLLMTASPNLTQQFQVAILLSVFASLMPYMYALVALPVIMIAHKVNKGPTFMFYTVLVVIGMAFCVFALLGSGSDSLYWGTLVMALTIPMYSFVAHSKHQQGEEILHMLSAEESA